MKHLAKFALGAMAFIVASCNSDEPAVNGPGNADGNGDVYATLNLKLPNGGTRAADGEEFGQDSENYVGKILVVLATKDADGENYCYLTRSEADAYPGGTLTPGDHESAKTELKYTLTFNAESMIDATSSQTVYVFAFCNPTQRLLGHFSGMAPGTAFTKQKLYGTISTDNKIWGENKFLMSNCEISAPVTIPTKAELITNHNKPEKALNLGTVHVKRVVARFDFALGGDNKDNKYIIKNLASETPNEEMGTVELTDMAMFNIAKNFYYLPRTNTQWDWKGTTKLCGYLETDYVMSFNENNFKNANSLSNYQQYYFANLINNKFETGTPDKPSTEDPDAYGGSTALTWTSIRPADWIKKTEDTNEGWTQDPKNDYRIWRYATENTIPAANGEENTASQKVGITTGVVFKGEFTPADSKKDKWNGNVVYVYNGTVYGDIKALKDYVTKYPETVVKKDFDLVEKLKNADPTTDLKTNLLKDLNKEACHGFKAYEADANGKYIMYYFYYNRHNSNNDNFNMGENEFGVVRNNVYKLQVTKCGSLGEPKSPDNPDNPNEEENAYFTVSCHVMPWTVRINNIEF